MSASVPRPLAPIVFAYATFILAGLSAGVGGVLLPAQIGDYGLDKATIGVTFFAFSAGFLLAGSTAGALIHRLGTRTALSVGGLAYVAAGLYTATRPAFVALVAVQIVAGYGTGVLESVLNAHLATLPGSTTLLNWLHAFFGVGALAGPPLATWMLGFTAWTSVWLVLALACVPLVAGFHLTLRAATPDPAAATAPDTAPDGAPGAAAVAGGGLFGAAVRRPAVLLGAVFLAVYVGLEISVGNWGFSFLVGERGQGDLVAGYTISGYWLGLTLGRFVLSPLAARLGWTATRLTFACLAGVTFATALLWAAPVTVVAVAAFALLGFFLGPIFPTTMAVAPSFAGDRLAPTTIGLLNGVSVIGGALFPFLAGVIADRAGIWTLPPFVVVLAVVQLVVWWRTVQHLAAPAPLAAAGH
ncbi:MFS transporter [Dactylosporangium sp. NPDC050688]|uniref:MFS transporter n=1 Tax=Dactylosporangium sp. NPDC050688 TaxID=3157217 RepID=UPI0033D874AB